MFGFVPFIFSASRQRAIVQLRRQLTGTVAGCHSLQGASSGLYRLSY